MTVNVARRGRRRDSMSGASATGTSEANPLPGESMTIGEIDQTVFDCPNCRRPLALGARRCPGCGTRLINGTPLGKASVFVVGGLTLGLLLGVGGGFVVGSSRVAAGAPAASAAPGAGGGGLGRASAGPSIRASAAPAATPVPVTAMPPVTRSSLAQALATNRRLAAAASDLRSAVNASSVFDASAVAQTLRMISAESLFGSQMASNVAAWTGSSALGTELGTFYGSAHDIASNGLDASVRNAAAYRATAISMIRLLDGINVIDAAVRAGAAAAGVTLPEPSAAP